MEQEQSREPLSGIRVLDLTIGVMGPTACVFLSDMGAEVIKVEPPEGDGTRFARGARNDLQASALTPMVIATNRGKKSVLLDAHGDLGHQAILRLAESADVLVTNYREDALRRLRLTYEDIRVVNPRIIYVSGTGYGRRGPEAERAMVDGGGQARGGLNSVTGQQAGAPCEIGAVISDTAGGLQMALAAMTGLLVRERFGIGQRLDSSAYGAQLWLQQWEIAQASMTGTVPGREGQHSPDFPGSYGIYETEDGGWVFFGMAQDETSWRAFWEFAGMPEIGLDSRWDTPRKRSGMDSAAAAANAAAARPLVAAALRRRPLEKWLSFLKGQPEIISSPVFDYGDILRDEQALDNGYLVELDIPEVGLRRVVGNLVELSETPGSVKGLPAEMGQHTEEILLSLGYDWHEVEAINGESREALRRKFAAFGLNPDGTPLSTRDD